MLGGPRRIAQRGYALAHGLDADRELLRVKDIDLLAALDLFCGRKVDLCFAAREVGCVTAGTEKESALL